MGSKVVTEAHTHSLVTAVMTHRPAETFQTYFSDHMHITMARMCFRDAMGCAIGSSGVIEMHS